MTSHTKRIQCSCHESGCVIIMPTLHKAWLKLPWESQAATEKSQPSTQRCQLGRDLKTPKKRWQFPTRLLINLLCRTWGSTQTFDQLRMHSYSLYYSCLTASRLEPSGAQRTVYCCTIWIHLAPTTWYEIISATNNKNRKHGGWSRCFSSFKAEPLFQFLQLFLHVLPVLEAHFGSKLVRATVRGLLSPAPLHWQICSLIWSNLLAKLRCLFEE